MPRPASPSPTSKPALVVFDLDGTLVDAFEDIRSAVNHALAAHHLPTHDLATIKAWVGDGISTLIARALSHPSMPPGAMAHHASVLAAARGYYAEHYADAARVYDGMADCVATIRAAGARTAILTNKPDAITQPLCERLGLRPLFDAIQGEVHGRPIKPDAAALDGLIADQASHRLAVVGDGRPDGELARNSGAAFFGLGWGIEPAERLVEFGPVTCDADELRTWLMAWLAGDRVGVEKV